jgi:uncharacterized protein YpmB
VGNKMKKIFILIGFSLSVMVLFGYQFFHYIDADYKADLRKAKNIALSKTVLTSIADVDHFSGEQDYFIFKGIDVLNQEAWVWISKEGETHTEYVHSNATLEEIKQATLKEDPGLDILRIVPGKLGQTWAWEVFGKNNKEKRFIYHYFDFKTGDLLRSYRLNKRIGS